jgi:hypothetical protein
MTHHPDPCLLHLTKFTFNRYMRQKTQYYRTYRVQPFCLLTPGIDNSPSSSHYFKKNTSEISSLYKLSDL